MTAYTVNPGQTSSGLTLTGSDSLVVQSGGIAIATQIIDGYAGIPDFTVEGGGVAVNTNVTGGNTFFVFVLSSGVISNTVMAGDSTGSPVAHVEGQAFDTVLTGGAQQFLDGGVASGTLVSNLGHENVEHGGVSIAPTISQGGYEDVFTGGTTQGATVLAGGQVDDFGVTSGTVVSGGGTEFIALDPGYSTPGNAFDTIVTSGGMQVVGGFAVATAGGNSFRTVVSSGGIEAVQEYGTTSGTRVLSGGVQTVAGYRVLADGTVVSNGGLQRVFGGGVENGTVVSSGGILQTEQGGTSTSATVLSGGQELVLSGGTDTGATVSSGGTLVISGGGVASASTIAGGTETVFGTINGATISAGVLDLAAPGAASTGTLTFAAGGTGTLLVGSGDAPAAVLAGFDVGDTIDLAGTGPAVLQPDGNNEFTVAGSNGPNSVVTLQFDPAFDPTSEHLRLIPDGSGGTDLVVTRAPQIGGAPTNPISTTDEASVMPFTGLSITDPNAGTAVDTLTVTPGTAGTGTLSATAGGTVTNGTFTISGSAQQVTAALQGLRFTPTAHQVAPGSTVTTSFGILDSTSADPALATAIVSVAATAVNDAPIITGAKSGQTTNDLTPTKPFAGVAVADVDTGVQDSLTITLTNAAGQATDANGTLSGAGLIKTGTGTYSLAAAAPAELSQQLDALTFTPVRGEVAPGSTVTTGFTLTASQTAGGSTVSATNSSTSVTVTALSVINGPAGGHAVLTGTPGSDVITAHGQYNAIFGQGGADIINAGDGFAAVTLGNGNASVTLGGRANAVIGGAGNVTVTGAPGGYTAVTLGNGNDTVQIGGSHDVILLGTGTDMVSGTQGMAFITTGAGNDTIKLGGSGSTVNAGGGNNSITGGTGQDTFVLPAAGGGFDSISGFTESNGDVLDLRASLSATSWNHKSSTLANYLKVTDSGGSTNLAISPTGAGSGTAIASLTGTNYSLSDLLSHHSLLTT